MIVLLSLTSIQFNRIITKKVNKIQSPIGVQGYRGIRGVKGEAANNCKCDDSICYKKVMSYITLVYNEWCSITGYTQISPSKTINNKFIKQKVKEMCDNDTSPFHLLLERDGSNKFPYYYFVEGLGKYKPCDINRNCGAFDYLFAKWREWILIILKYERGKDFLDSEDLTDLDFNTIGKNGMITENDMKYDTAKRYKCKWIFENPLLFPNIGVSYKFNETSLNYDEWFKEYLLQKSSSPDEGTKRFNLYLDKKEIFEQLDKNQTDDTKSLEQLREAYKDYTLEISQYLVSLEYFTEYFRKNIAIENINKPLFKMSTLKESDFYNFYNIPGVPSAMNCSTNSVQKIMSPFDVIRQFDSWYWGAPKLSRPKLVNECNVTKKYLISSTKPQIKLKLSNNYRKIWNSENIRQIKMVTHDTGEMVDIYIPFQDTGRTLVDNKYKALPHPNSQGSDFINSSESINSNIYIAKNYTDVSESELKFKYYYPVGCIVVPSNYIKKTNNDRCHPKTDSHTNIEDSLLNGPSICTILVSGDVLEPIGYNRIFVRKRTSGTMINEIGYSFWRPVAPKGYVALGDVISVNIDGTPPSTDLIRCVPEYCVEKDFLYSGNTLLDIYSTNSKYNRISNSPTNNIKSMTVYDTDYDPKIKAGNFENINLISNTNIVNPSLDYEFISSDTKKLEIKDSDKFSISYNIFRCAKASPNKITSPNYIQSVKSLFYKIKLDTLLFTEKVEKDDVYDSTEIINNKYDSKYSILNLYAKD